MKFLRPKYTTQFFAQNKYKTRYEQVKIAFTQLSKTYPELVLALGYFSIGVSLMLYGLYQFHTLDKPKKYHLEPRSRLIRELQT